MRRQTDPVACWHSVLGGPLRIDMWVIYGLVMLVSLKKHDFSITRFVLCVNFTLVKLTTLKKHVLDHHLMRNYVEHKLEDCKKMTLTICFDMKMKAVRIKH